MMFLGAILLIWNIPSLSLADWPMLLALIALGSVAIVIRELGATNRWHITINFVAYSFCMLRLDTAGTMLVILISNLVFWIWYRGEFGNKWYIILFNTACYIFVAQTTILIYRWINPTSRLDTWLSVAGIVVGMLVFTLLNHLLVGIIVWLARGQNFTESGVFDFMPLIIDLTLLIMGASLNIAWNYNPYATVLLLLPLYLIYSTLRVPALERQAEVDQKTGLYNHNYFMLQLENELKRANRFDRPLMVILADLDLLRNVNNTYGHLAGDEVLKGVAHIMKSLVREYDVVARFGGEEFAIFMPETNTNTAYERAEEIRLAIERAEFTVPTSVTPIKITMSFGIAGRENAKQTKEEIIHNADVVLYYSKHKGRNCTHIYTPGEYDPEILNETSPETSGNTPEKPATHDYPAANYQNIKEQIQEQPPEQPHEAQAQPVQTGYVSSPPALRPATQQNSTRIQIYIILVMIAAGLLFGLNYQPLSAGNVLGLLLFVVMLIFTEWISLDLYVRDTAISTSAVPMLAGTLLFGPVGALVLSIAFALTSYFKFRGPFSRILFNASNQLIAAMLYLGILRLILVPFSQWLTSLQLLYTIFAMTIAYLVTTILVAIGIHLNNGGGLFQIWREQFHWLGPYYLVMGLIAYALVFGYTTANFLGIILVVAPLLMLRFSQVQYIQHTRKMVAEVREKNARLENIAREISSINYGLLDTLAEVIDLRDHYVLSHSRRVTEYAVSISEILGLNPKQIEVVRKASLLHDIGKLGIPDAILGKPGSLTHEEYQVIQQHAEMGAALLEKSPSLRGLIPPIKHHHEAYDGSGYPLGLKGNQIPIEARIVAVADAIEAMASDRPYRQARPPATIIAELTRCSGTQFDPQVVEIAIQLIKTQKIV